MLLNNRKWKDVRKVVLTLGTSFFAQFALLELFVVFMKKMI